MAHESDIVERFPVFHMGSADQWVRMTKEELEALHEYMAPVATLMQQRGLAADGLELLLSRVRVVLENAS